ncbi:splicing factor 3A subunit 1-like [Macrobrachium nipponense]|uniref:splicing factor 3A subunit 1-like n=1 Tax=Macrobrachium nipponense TaxID=159736 RepID=UPI0030C80642
MYLTEEYLPPPPKPSVVTPQPVMAVNIRGPMPSVAPVMVVPPVMMAPRPASFMPGPHAPHVPRIMVLQPPQIAPDGADTFTDLPVTDPVSVVKAKPHEEIGLPPGKHKLARDGLFFKDSQSLTYYNVGSGTVIHS